MQDNYDYMGHSNMGHSNMGHSNMGHSNMGHSNMVDSYDYLSAEETGIKPVDDVITKTLAFEQSHLGQPLVQFALLGLAGFGAYTLIKKFM